jgi:mono/diheme cytochrome c family protein
VIGVVFIIVWENCMRSLTRYILPAAILSTLVVSLSCPQLARGLTKPESGFFNFAVRIVAQTPQPADNTLKSGKERYAKNCSGCHGGLGEGYAGPNLTDRYWIHGGGLKNICTAIAGGVPTKGMIGWNAIFSQKEIQEVASYILTLQGTDPPKARKPEGVLHDNGR